MLQSCRARSKWSESWCRLLPVLLLFNLLLVKSATGVIQIFKGSPVFFIEVSEAAGLTGTFDGDVLWATNVLRESFGVFMARFRSVNGETLFCISRYTAVHDISCHHCVCRVLFHASLVLFLFFPLFSRPRW